MMVDDNDVSNSARERLKATVNNAVNRTGRRTGSTEAGKAAIRDLAPLIGAIVCVAGASVGWLTAILLDENKNR